MPRVLLVDPDVEALGEVASALRSRGFAVANAIDAYEAVEAAYKTAPDAVLVVSSLDQDGELTQALRLIPQLQHLPVLAFPEQRDPGGRRVAGMTEGDLEVVVTRILEACPRPSQQSDPGVSDELRGNLSQRGLADLLQMLQMNKRSGTVTVTLSGGNGEIRVDEGEIADASYRRLEGEKQQAADYGAANFARDMLAIKDHLERALVAVTDELRSDKVASSFLTGIESTAREIESAFARHGITRIKSIGEKLDPHRHQAMIEIATDSAEPGTIVEEMQSGYMLKDRLLRPALVGVAKAG